MIAPPFRLYPEERHWWSFNDYGAVLGIMARLHPKRVLEFGPGSSTLALIEGGAAHIDTCEDNPDWLNVYRQRLEQAYPEIVHLHAYTWRTPLSVPTLGRQRYDLAFIDGPLGSEQRAPVIEFALKRATSVFLPTEDEGRQHKSVIRPVVLRLAAMYGYDVEFMETGPLSGGFALMTKKARRQTASLGDAR